MSAERKLAGLVDLLSMEKIEENLFRGQSVDLGWGRVFGGQVLGQAVSAAEQTVPEDRVLHSIHCYFLRPGDVKAPIVYEVDRIRDGRSFTTRRVVAIQHGKAILNMSSSFQIAEEGFSHQDTMPEVPEPESLPTVQEVYARYSDRIPKFIRDKAMSEGPIEIRPVTYVDDPIAPSIAPPIKRYWFKAAAPLPDDPRIHRYLLAYLSDSDFLITALQPHGMTWLSPGMQTASLDHVMWFHRPFRVDEWMLYDIHSPAATGARGLVRGSFYDRSGRLVASAAQEGLLRQHTPTTSS